MDYVALQSAQWFYLWVYRMTQDTKSIRILCCSNMAKLHHLSILLIDIPENRRLIDIYITPLFKIQFVPKPNRILRDLNKENAIYLNDIWSSWKYQVIEIWTILYTVIKSYYFTYKMFNWPEKLKYCLLSKNSKIFINIATLEVSKKLKLYRFSDNIKFRETLNGNKSK